MSAGNRWRVRPIRAVNGRVQVFAVEMRTPHGTWVEWTALPTHSLAMTSADRLARGVGR